MSKEKTRDFLLKGQLYPSYVKTLEKQQKFEQEYSEAYDDLNNAIIGYKTSAGRDNFIKINNRFFIICDRKDLILVN